MDVTQEVLSDITVYMKYARFNKDLQRRETWDEITTRNKNMHISKFPDLKEEIEKAYQFVYDKKVLPSMRSLQFGGTPIELNNARIFNCSFLPIDDYRSFSEAMFLLLSG
jgi:ribonucleoside-diphosphate reductase alpha chain